MPTERKNRIVFVDFPELKKQREQLLGRKLSKVEENVLGEADAIRIDAMACGNCGGNR